MSLRDAAGRAAGFIAVQGDAFARARADALLGAAGADPVVERLSPDLEDPEALRRALETADDLRARDAAPVRGWVEALARAQAPDGGWLPGRPLEERLFTSGMLGGHLAKTRHVRPEVMDGVTEFLAGHWTPDRVREGSWNAIAAYAHLFANADHDSADAILQWCGRELGRAFLTRVFDAVRTARVLVYCDAHGLPGADLPTDTLRVALLSEQAPDGSFAAWEGEGARDVVASTLDGLLALCRLEGRAPPATEPH